MTNDLIKNIIGITETKIFMLDALIRLIDRTGKPITKLDLG